MVVSYSDSMAYGDVLVISRKGLMAIDGRSLVSSYDLVANNDNQPWRVMSSMVIVKNNYKIW